jgi:hypothetical protein
VQCGGLLTAREKVYDDKEKGAFAKVILCAAAARRIKPSPVPPCSLFVAIPVVVLVVSQPPPHLFWTPNGPRHRERGRHWTVHVVVCSNEGASTDIIFCSVRIRYLIECVVVFLFGSVPDWWYFGK